MLPKVAVLQYVLSPPSELVRCLSNAIFAGVRRGLAKALTVFPHVHVLVLDGAYTEASEEELVFHDDHGPATDEQHGLAEDVERRFVRWLRRHDLMKEEAEEPEGDEAFLLAAAREPSGLLRSASEPRRSLGFDVHVGRRIEVDDERARTSIVRHLRGYRRSKSACRAFARLRLAARPHGACALARPPFAEALLAKTYDRQDVGSAGEGRKPKPADVYGLACPRCEGPMRPVELVLPPKAEAVLADDALFELHPKTGPPAPHGRQVVLPLAG